MLERWAKVLDVVRYLRHELRIKEKEWGWSWRDKFLEQAKIEITALADFDIKHEALKQDERDPNYDPVRILHIVMSDGFK